ncbi:efflux RND transporter periplasmic adaptor subunit [Vibrio cincinnatiensis]|uniref:efflux RND transporter periplasmic adaptor subunit n=1 Tax=Vibrio cincinnatiensis TaxID=675 RepID=UPI0013025ABA|nr:efflux RND transporter periplasmic adaptor subunit [Vibrio cincinnatiensis]
MKKTSFFVRSLCLLTVIWTFPTLASNEVKGVPVVIETVQTHQVSQSLSLVGKLQADQSVNVASEVSGKVALIAVKTNQTVKKGQLLVKLNDDKAQAAVTEAQAYWADEQRKLTEFERLVKRSAITQTELDAQKASVDIAQARLDAAKAQLADLHIMAPFDGTIGFIDFSHGQLVSVGSELMTLDNLSLMRLDLSIPERYLSSLSLGMTVLGQTSAWPDQTFNGTLVAMNSRINPETLNLPVRIHFDNKDGKLKPGMLVSARIHFPAIRAPIIPVQALEYSGTKRYVYVLGDDQRVTRTEVFLGARIENQVVIEKGLSIGERIVVQGIVNMRDGLSVMEVTPEGYPIDRGEQ